jgi:exo-beta-1,3-glucanase (GH17 family)
MALTSDKDGHWSCWASKRTKSRNSKSPSHASGISEGGAALKEYVSVGSCRCSSKKFQIDSEMLLRNFCRLTDQVFNDNERYSTIDEAS